MTAKTWSALRVGETARMEILDGQGGLVCVTDDNRADEIVEVRAALHALVDAANTVDHEADADIYTDAPECHDSVRLFHNAIGLMQAAIGRGLRALRGEKSPVDYKAVCDQIFIQLNGEEWDSDTTSAIAEIITEAGYKIRDPNEEGDDE